MAHKFDERKLSPSRFATVEEKLKFCNAFKRFVEAGFPVEKFTKSFYNRLSMCFGHIAHYNKNGFYDVWFSSPERQHEFIRHTLKYPCYGSSEYTFSDAEKLIIDYLKGKNNES